MIDARFIQSFWKKVDKTDDCWVWTGSQKSNGYGEVHVGSRKLPKRAHQVSLVLSGIALTPGLVVDHLCRNRLCVKPDHLRQVTNKVNSLENSRGVGAIHASRTVCPKGHEYSSENTRRDKHGKRYCKACSRLRREGKS